MLGRILLIWLFAASAAMAQSYPSPTYNTMTITSKNGLIVGNGSSPISAIAPGTGVSAALSNAVNGANGLLVFGVSGAAIGYTQTGTSAVVNTVVKKINQYPITPQDFGAVGDNSTDDATAFQLAINAAQSQSRALYIPRASYALSSQLSTTTPIDIDSDPSANLRWTNSTSSGWLFDFRAAGSNFGLNEIRLPNLYSAGVTSSFTYPGYPSSWTTSNRFGDAVILEGGSRINFYIHYMLGWQRGLHLLATYDVTNGARAPQNINFDINTADIMEEGVLLDGGVSGSGAMSAIVGNINTVFAKYPIYINASNTAIGQVRINVNGQAFTNEANGAIVFGYACAFNTSEIHVNWAYAGYGSDSPSGTSSTLTLPYVSGTGTSHGTSTDGNGTTGYFCGYNNDISVGVAIDQASNPGGSLPQSGNVVRVRDVGVNNKMFVQHYEQAQGASIALSQSQGEANYNGGVGGASMSRRQIVSVAVPTMSNGTTQLFFFYNTLLSAGFKKPMRIIPVDQTVNISGLIFSVYDNSGTNNREAVIEIDNKSGGSISGSTYYFWVEVDN